jgi:hypothetical protein
MAMEVYRVRHRASLMPHELSAVLWGDDPYGVSRKAVAERLDRNLWKTCRTEDGSPSFIESEERPAGLVTGNGQMLRPRGAWNLLETADRIRTEKNPSSCSLAASISFGPRDTDSGYRVI